ncbi:unnamed protein product [Timema podura]|uniref:Methyltransferase type 11 domain-containing protein n=1 Tax=Timema podura TaxID=61482 RepID=A0ABN7NK47_TIMPD|nr:unnamed protein product [Timema podura]
MRITQLGLRVEQTQGCEEGERRTAPAANGPRDAIFLNPALFLLACVLNDLTHSANQMYFSIWRYLLFYLHWFRVSGIKTHRMDVCEEFTRRGIEISSTVKLELMVLQPICQLDRLVIMFRYFREADHAALYKKFRHPTPDQLVTHIVNYITQQVKSHTLGSVPTTSHIRHFLHQISVPLGVAVDVGCGAGQSTLVLAPHFTSILGVDPSDAAIQEARGSNPPRNVQFRVGSAESLDVKPGSVHLVTASQACHWFNLPRFYRETERVLAPGGVLAMYGYLLPRPLLGDIQLGHIVDKYYNTTLGDYVLDGSKKVYLNNYRDQEFNSVPFIGEPLVRTSTTHGIVLNYFRDESVSADYQATVADLVGYVNSWSACQNYRRQHGDVNTANILTHFQDEIMQTIGASGAPEDTSITIQYKYFLLMGRKPLGLH